MKFKSPKVCFIALGLALAMTQAPESSLFAAGNEVKQAGCQRCQKARPLPPKKEQKLYSQMAQEAAKTKKRMEKRFGKTNPKQLAQKAVIDFQRINHVLTDVSPRGDTLTIQDGSAWSVAETYQDTAASWAQGQQMGELVYLEISPNLSIWHKLFGSENNPKYKYIVTNLRDGTYVETNLALGPFVNNPNTRRIRKIDFARGEVYFTNGTLWKCDTQGAVGQIFKEWRNGDYVITGVNDSWFKFWNQDIIINVSADNWIPAARVF
jgi:hypothetical protein